MEEVESEEVQEKNECDETQSHFCLSNPLVRFLSLFSSEMRRPAQEDSALVKGEEASLQGAGRWRRAGARRVSENRGRRGAANRRGAKRPDRGKKRGISSGDDEPEDGCPRKAFERSRGGLALRSGS